MHNVVVLLAAVWVPSQLPAEFVTLLPQFEYPYTGGGYHDRLFYYRLYAPPNTANASQRMPLIVWLHGMGEAGDGTVSHLRWLDRFVFRRAWERPTYPFFLLAVQCPSDNPAWTRGSPSEDGDDMINVAKAILDKTLQDYPIDRDRVLLTGLSSGGSGCWEFALRYPEYFAAVAPMSSGGGDTARVSQIKNIPVWAFHCDRDGGIESVRSTVQALKIAGGNVHLTEINAASHDSWTSAFNEYHLLDWLLAQRRGHADSSPAPGTISLGRRLEDLVKGWQWWQILVQVAVPLALVLAVRQAIKQRRRTRGYS